MHVFDPSQPHGQVCGTAVRLWEQNGVLFDSGHRPVTLLDDGSIRPIEIAAAEPQEAISPDDYRSMSTDKLKQVCTVYGVEFRNRQQAIAELEGR